MSDFNKDVTNDNGADSELAEDKVIEGDNADNSVTEGDSADDSVTEGDNADDNDNEVYAYDSEEVRHGFRRGLVFGIVMTVFSMLIIISGVVAALVVSGYIHISSKGEIYVQDAAVTDESGIGSKVESKLNTIDSLLDGFYYDDANESEAEDAIIKAYVQSYGDVYTTYYTAEEYKKLTESTTGVFYGIGAVMTKYTDTNLTEILSVYDDSPASKAGIEAGDILISVDGENIDDLTLTEITSKIRGDNGTNVLLGIKRGDESLSITVTRGAVEIKTVAYEMLEDNVGYIYVSKFEDATVEQFKKAVDDLTSQGAVGIIFDLRDNPGGVLNSAIKMLSYILPNGDYISSVDKAGNKKVYTGNDDSEVTVPMALLVNGDSASASEVFASTFKDYNAGKIFGTTTYGKGIVQTIRPLTDGTAIKYTTAEYYSPNGTVIHGVGVTPDVVVDEDLEPEYDNTLEAAYDYILSCQ